MGLRLVFWNSGVAPTRGRGKRDRDEAISIVRSLFTDGVDLVALCEVDEGFVQTAGAELGCQSVSITESVGKSRWDLAVLHSAGVRCTKGSPTVFLDGPTTIRAAYSVKVQSVGEVPFHLFLLHWRSRLRGDDSYRQKAAHSLWQGVERLLKNSEPVLIAGDFNDEPFDLSLHRFLRATRDPRHAVRNPKSRLYNPTWWLACPVGESPWSLFGSIGYAGETTDRFLFDQALVSAHFLNEETGSAPVARLRRIGQSVDHLPLELILP